ncbi:hypothetical protein ATY35_05475 [Vibrio cidicii]|uniref:Uncharacterized protein n=1 Tax=Vibrio cidicii TaxID=1763883 RepID=A0ABR5VY67_9VIBR|nr:MULTISPECIES: hypothetical protein [Vibrio]EIY4765760.1 hypothetical protein [Vibrio cholerae]KYN82707.1 hypothetical protein ATY35_05475 [Vibrio cidicii]RBM31328.1 hypothetical protein DLR59_00800 [Vibrio tarriae]
MKTTNLGLFVDTQGNHHTVIMCIEQHAFTPMRGGKTIYRDGHKDFKTTTGIELNRIGDKFQTLDGNVLSPVETD